jgi:Na+/glutamate symporter
MSEHGFHVHGPHDHELEHAARHSPEGHAGQLAVITAILATVGALFAYMGGATQANAGLFKNESAIRHTQASDKWNFYQAKSNKQNLAEFAIATLPEDKRAPFADKAKRYEGEKADIMKEAQALEKEAEDWSHKSDAQLHQHHRWAQATTALQIAIAMAAIALLTRRRWTEYAVYVLSVLGVALGIGAWFHL